MKIQIQDFVEFDSIGSFDEDVFFHHLQQAVVQLLADILPENTIEDKKLPLIVWKEKNNHLQIIALCKKTLSSSDFFQEMIARWLLPYQLLSVENFFSYNMRFSHFPKETFSLMQATVRFSHEKQSQDICKNKKAIDIELRLGLSSDYHANRILEFKGLSEDKKTIMIQEKIASLIRSRSKDFGKSIFTHMQHFLVTSSDDFKRQRDYHHLSRIISIFFLMRKLLQKKIESFPQKRHIMMKFLKTKIQKDSQEQKVLGILVGLNFLQQHEVFEKKHLLRTVKEFLQDIQCEEESFLIERDDIAKVATLYLEVRKINAEEFSFAEIEKLRIHMPEYLSQHIEKLVYPIFMPRNEEEIMKNILTLSRQVKQIHDIPQVILNFDEQTDQHLSFTVIFVRVLRGFSLSVEKMCLDKPAQFIFQLDRIKKVGVVRRKYVKEATVFHAKMPLQKYLRIDHYVDLQKARLDLLQELIAIFGDVRDFNGGIIAKQQEALRYLKNIIKPIDKPQELLLEKFFYAIQPVPLGLIVDKKILANSFFMLTNAIKREKAKSYKQKQNWLFKQEAKAVFIIISCCNNDTKHFLDETIGTLDLLTSEIFSFFLSSEENTFLGYVYLCENKENQKSFLRKIQEALDF